MSLSRPMKSNFPSTALRGVVESIHSYNPENGFALARLMPETTTDVIDISGYLPGLCAGEWLQVRGIWAKHSHAGWHLEVTQYCYVTPGAGADLEIFLANVLQGVTPELAERIVQNCGVDTIRIIEQAPARLAEIKGLTPPRIRQLRASWDQWKNKSELSALLQNPSIERKLAMRIYNAFRAGKAKDKKTFQQLEAELYALDFTPAETIARFLGTKPNSTARVDAAVRKALAQWIAEGHVLAHRADLNLQCAALLGEGSRLNQKTIGQAIRRLVKKQQIIVEANRIYPKPLYELEVSIAARVRVHQTSRATRLGELQEKDWSKVLNGLALSAHTALTPQQQQAIRTALTSKLSILTGGPGTGKTTAVRALVALLKKRGYTVQLAAPTGRAAKRLSQASAAPAQTLHRLLAFKPLSAKKKKRAQAEAPKFAPGLDQPLDADLLIIDECSMLDLSLTNNLLRALDPGTHLLLIGDPNQLPSIGSGKVLQDLIDSKAAPVTALDTVFRQKKESGIITNAHRIHKGQFPFVAPDAHGFYLVQEHRAERAAAQVVNLVTNWIPMEFGFDSLEDIKVLSPTHHGPAGVSALNASLQAVLNPSDGRKREWLHHDRVLRVGDQVMQTRNNYAKGVFNGDQGRIVEIDFRATKIKIDFDGTGVEYGFNELDEIAHAFAMTVHKAQGSESRAIVLVLLPQHRKLLQRNLLYTAVTRARELVVIVGAPNALSAALKNNKPAERQTHLAQRLAQRRAGRSPRK